MGRVLLERTKKYLFIPYEEGTVDQKIQIRDKSKKEFSFYYPIASSHVSGWGRIELPIEMVGETVEIITERDAMIEAIYTREQCYGLVERHPMEPWIHFHIPFGKILSVKSLYQDGKENWRMYLLEDFSMGLQSNKGMIREYESKDLYYWKEVGQEISDFRIADNTEKFPLIGDVEEFIRATDKNGDTYGFALSKTFRLEQSPVTNVLSIPININGNKIQPIKELKRLRVWKRDWYLKEIEKEFYFECRFQIEPGEWPGITIVDKTRTMEDIRAGVIEVELEILVGMEEEILIELSGLHWRWSALTRKLRCKDYEIPVTEKDGRLVLHFFCDHVVQEVFADSGVGMLVTYSEEIIFLAGLKTVPTEIYEASSIEGANAWQKLRYITLPMIKDSIVIVIVLAVNGALKIFELVYQMTNGGPNHKSETAVTYMYYIMFKSGKYSYGSAMAVVVLVACMIFTLIYIRNVKDNLE